MGLFDQTSGNNKGLSPAAIALLGLLAVKGFENRDKLSEMLGGLFGGQTSGASPGGGLGGLLGGSTGGGLLGSLGGLLGGQTTGGAVSGGLGSLVESFEKAGHGDIANSWVKDGPDQQPAPQQIEEAVGGDVLDQLSKATGLSRAELLQRLTQALPKAVDALTPDSRIPTAEEAHLQVTGKTG